MRTEHATTIATYCILALAGAGSIALPDSLPGAQASGGGGATPAIFRMSGPVIDGYDGRYGNAMLDSVEFPTGDVFNEFIMAKAITDFSYSGAGDGSIRVLTAHDSTVGDPGLFDLDDEDGNGSDISLADQDLFNARILSAYQNRNLNSYFDLSCDCPFSYVIEFEEPVVDNDENADGLGEILYLERGADAGNSWLLLTVVDESGNTLGTPVAIAPEETISTSPPTLLGRYNTNGTLRTGTQEMGCAAIDLSRLGVSEMRFLRVSTPPPGLYGYTGGERAPDGKIFVVMTTPRAPDPLVFFD